MRRLIIFLVAAMTLASCGSESDKFTVLPNGDTLTMHYTVGKRHVGEIRRGMTIARVNKTYGENNVKRLRSAMSVADSTGKQKYYIYNDDNHLELVVQTRENMGDKVVCDVVIKDKGFLTPEGIGLKSNVDKIRAQYPDAQLIQGADKFFIFVPQYDLYFGINNKYVAEYNPEFVADLPLSNVEGKALPEMMVVSWESRKSDMFTTLYWEDKFASLLQWIVVQLPSILIIILLFIVVKKAFTIAVNKVKRVANKRIHADKNIDNTEAIKRLDTITGIVQGVFNIVAWSILILWLLSKFNINIGPILASAGILGLAVGFGAQELVRDFISGFFILLENQLRTGDMAIINNTTGVVEKIELRTVTLRDESGVVHIFQNGKINSLSNMTKEWSAIVLKIGVAYKEDVDRVIDIMKQVGDQLRHSDLGEPMLQDVDVWGLDNFADSSVVIKMSIKTRPMEQWRIKREYQRLLKIRFDAEGIEIPYPHLSIYSGDASQPAITSLADDAKECNSPTPEEKSNKNNF